MQKIEPGKTGERFPDLLWEVYTYAKEHPEAGKMIENREFVPWRYKSDKLDDDEIPGWDEFGAALWTLNLMALKSIVIKGIQECRKDGKARVLLTEILDLLQNSPVNKDILSCTSDDLDAFTDKIYDLSYNTREALADWELYDDYPLLALDMLDAYVGCLRENVFREFAIDWSK